MTSNETFGKRKLCLDSENKWILGICAGIAKYFEIETTFVRIAFIIALFTFPYIIPIYIVMYFCLTKESKPLRAFGETISNNRVGRHFREVDYSKRLYKSRSDRRISGVCGGIAAYIETSSFLVRMVFVLALLSGGPFIVLVYFALAIILNRNPNEEDSQRSRRYRRYRGCGQRYNSAADTARDYKESSYGKNSYSRRRRYQQETEQTFDKRDLKETTGKFYELEEKLRRLEASITSKKFKLHTEFKNM